MRRLAAASATRASRFDEVIGFMNMVSKPVLALGTHSGIDFFAAHPDTLPKLLANSPRDDRIPISIASRSDAFKLTLGRRKRLLDLVDESQATLASFEVVRTLGLSPVSSFLMTWIQFQYQTRSWLLTRTGHFPIVIQPPGNPQ